MKSLLAIDPGAKGGIATMIDGTVTAEKMPETVRDLCDVIELFQMNAILAAKDSTKAEYMAYVEQVSGYTGEGQPGSSAFVFGEGYGQIIGILTALEIPYELVRPQRWIKALSLGSVGSVKPNYIGLNEEQRKAEKKRVQRLNGQARTEWKNKLKNRAQAIHPHLKVTLATSDALLLLEFGSRCHLSPEEREQKYERLLQ